jgi:hypothetical protein
MKWLGILAAITFLAGCDKRSGLSEVNEANELSIRALWTAHQIAIKISDGDQVASQFSQETIAHYDQVVQLAKNATLSEFEREPLGRSFSALRARIKVPADELKSLSGMELVARNHKFPTTDPSQQPILELSSIVIDGSAASAMKTGLGVTSADAIHFVKEPDGWKIDGVKSLIESERKLEARRQNLGLSKIDLLKTLIEQSSGQSVSDDIWRPQR